ncbi:MAG: hypothetical protein ABSB74_20340 [Tepidisphaeraceae bacterium]
MSRRVTPYLGRLIRVFGIAGCIAVAVSVIPARADSTDIPVPGAADPNLTSNTYEGHPIHIYVRPDNDTPPDQRAVLLLGMVSNAAEVTKDANLINPRTGKPYDVIVGVGADSIAGELKRAVAEDHLCADQNALALKEAFAAQFNGPLQAASLDMHSNGNTVGIAAIQMDAFSGVKDLSAMGPDIGYSGHYFTPDTLAQLKAHGVDTMHIYVNRGDFVPTLGWVSAELVHSITDNTVGSALHQLADNALDYLHGQTQAAAPPTGSPDAIPTVSYQEFASLGQPIRIRDGKLIFPNHSVANYLSLRAGQIPAEDLDAMAENDPELNADLELMERAVRDGRSDLLAACMEHFGSKADQNTLLASRQDVLKSMMGMLQADRTRHFAMQLKLLKQLDEFEAKQRAIRLAAQKAAQRQQITAAWSQPNMMPQPFPQPEPEPDGNSGSDNYARGNNNNSNSQIHSFNSPTYNQLRTGNFSW